MGIQEEDLTNRTFQVKISWVVCKCGLMYGFLTTGRRGVVNATSTKKGLWSDLVKMVNNGLMYGFLTTWRRKVVS
jgi:hypothetical protein